MFDMRTVLSVPAAYRTLQQLVAARHMYAEFVEKYVRVGPDQRVLDIGCGPADILDFLPECDYVGVDLSNRYVESARARFGSRGTFHCLPVAEMTVREPASFDIVIAKGLVHHLDDLEARKLFAVACEALKPGGRLVTFDGCFVPGQSRIARCLLSLDRGKYVRTEPEYLALAHESFDGVVPHLRHNLTRIPYTLLIMECTRTIAAS